MKVTLKEIAQRAGVSVNTVSLALRNMPSVKQDTKDLIFKLADEMGYFEQKGKVETQNIGLISTGERLRDSYFYMSFYQHILSKSHDSGFNMMVFQGTACNVDPEELKKRFDANAVVGVIILGDMDERIVAKVAGSNIPLVATGARYHDLKVTTIIEDNLEGCYQGIRYFYKRGYRRIGFIGNPCHSTGFMERYQGFTGAMQKFQLPILPEDLIINMDSRQVYDHEYIYKALSKMESIPEAFLCANDNLAMITAKVLHNMGKIIPEDIALMGFDNSAIGKMAIPSITSIDVQCALQAELCVKKLIDIIQKGHSEPQRILLPITLAEGESVQNLKKQEIKLCGLNPVELAKRAKY